MGTKSPQAEAFCTYCLQILTAEMINIQNCGINIDALISDQSVS